LKTNNCAQQVV